MQNNTFSGLFVGQNLVKLSAVASTNAYVKEVLSNSAPLPEGTVIMAENQFEGRGQQQNTWLSEAGKNLTFSVLLSPVFLQITQQFELNKAISLAVLDVLKPLLGSSVSIKWPNDILVDKQKIAGILIENIVQGSRWKHAVIGIGLNVNQTEFPDSLNATSIRTILHRDCDLNQLLADLCRAIEARYLALKSRKFDRIHQEYLNGLYKFEDSATFKLGDELKTGRIIGVSNIGLLQIDFGDQIREFGFKEIGFIID